MLERPRPVAVVLPERAEVAAARPVVRPQQPPVAAVRPVALPQQAEAAAVVPPWLVHGLVAFQTRLRRSPCSATTARMSRSVVQPTYERAPSSRSRPNDRRWLSA